MEQPIQLEWGNDGLSKFIQDAFDNCKQAFYSCPEPFRRLVKINDMFERTRYIDWGRSIFQYFIARSWSSFLGAARLAISGQSAEAFACIRLCIEDALYAVLIHEYPKYGDIWVNRGRNCATTQKCRKTFKIHQKEEKKKVPGCIETLKKVDDAIGQDVEKLYEHCIAMGAHPNVGMLVGSEITNGVHNATILKQQANCCEFLEEAALSVLKVYQEILPDQMKQSGVVALFNSHVASGE